MLAVINRHADDLELPSNVDNVKLLTAMAMVESDGGRNLQPNFERAFYKGGHYWNTHLTELRAKWKSRADPKMRTWSGRAMACSWGPWQILYVTAEELGYWGPPWALTDADVCLTWAIRLINKRLAPKLPARLEELQIVSKIADGYNSGSFRDRYVPHDYIDKVLKYYKTDASSGELISLGPLANFG